MFPVPPQVKTKMTGMTKVTRPLVIHYMSALGAMTSRLSMLARFRLTVCILKSPMKVLL